MSHVADLPRDPSSGWFGVEPHVWEPTSDSQETPAQLVAYRLVDAIIHYWQPTTRRKETVSERFRRLADQWRDDTAFESSSTALGVHPAYQQIIGMGQDALPLILRELEDRGGHWYWALKAITGVDPVPPTERGRIQAMRQAWLNWGREQGLSW